MKEQEYFQEKMIESAEIMVDVSDTHKIHLNELKKLFKFSFGQSPKDFVKILDYMFFIRGIPKPESAGKLEKVIENFITAIRYFSYLGMDEDKINRQLSNFGITITKTDWSPEGGEKSSMKKFDKLFSSLYPNTEVPPVNAKLLKFLLDQGVKIQQDILSLTDEVSAIADTVETKCEVSKSSFVRGVNLKASVLRGNDISETVAKIENKADEVSEVIGTLG